MAPSRFASALASPLTASAVALVARFLLLGTGALTGILLPVSLAQDQVGLYFLIQSIVAGIATVGQLGLSITVPALISNALGRRDLPTVRASGQRSLVLCGLATLATYGVFAAGAGLLTRMSLVPMLGSLSPLMPWIGAIVVLAAVVTLVAEQHRTAGHYVQASFLAAGGSTVTAATLFICWRSDIALSLTELLAAGLVGVGICAMVGMSSLWRWLSSLGTKAGPTPSHLDLLRETSANLGTTVVLFVAAQADLWIIAIFGSPADVAIYGLASRLSALVLIPLAVVNSVVAPSIGAVWTRGKKRYLRHVLGAAAAAATILACTAYLIFLAFGQLAISRLWSTPYADAYYIFAILGLAQIAQSFAGGSGYVLMMLNKQHVAMRISVAGGAWILVVGSWAMAHFGVLGLAAAYGLSGILQPLAMAFFVKRHLDLDATARCRPIQRVAKSYLRRFMHHVG